MRLFDLIELVIETNQNVLDRYRVDLHRERPVIRGLWSLDEHHPSERNTGVTLFVNTDRVKGEQTYFYNRIDIRGVVWPYSHHPVLQMEDVLRDGVYESLLALQDPLIDYDLLKEIFEGSFTEMDVLYQSTTSVDPHAFISVNSIGYYGVASIVLEGIPSEHEVVHLSLVVDNTVLDGFYLPDHQGV